MLNQKKEVVAALKSASVTLEEAAATLEYAASQATETEGERSDLRGPAALAISALSDAAENLAALILEGSER